jgi:hypothetical protein
VRGKLAESPVLRRCVVGTSTPPSSRASATVARGGGSESKLLGGPQRADLGGTRNRARGRLSARPGAPPD